MNLIESLPLPLPPLEPVYAEFATIIGYAISLIISVALSYLSYALRKKPKNNFKFDDTPTTIVQRGAYLPYIIGTRRVGPMFCWAGKRRTTSRKPGGGDTRVYTYWEAAWHVLALGPAVRLDKILSDGKVVFQGPITPADTPNGSSIDIMNAGVYEGTARIYWGTHDQPVDAVLSASDALNIKSRWKHLVYIVWNDKKLGQSPLWPQLEYEITCAPVPTAGDGLQDTDYWIGNPAVGGTDGVNAMHAAWQIMTASFPHGVAIDPAKLDGGAFEAIAAHASVSTLPLNVLAADGPDAASALGGIMEDVGFVLDQSGDILVPYLIRAEAGTPPVLDNDIVIDPNFPVIRQHGEIRPDKTVFVFKDRTNNYRDMDMARSDDAHARTRARQQTISVPMVNVTDHATASKVSTRRESEFMVDGTAVRFKAQRAARMLHAGQIFTLPNLGRFRVANVAFSYASPEVEIEAVADQYSHERGTYVPPSRPVTPGTGELPVPDLYFVPFAALDDPMALFVFRARGSVDVLGADVWFADIESGPYTRLGEQDATAYGGWTLLTAAELANTAGDNEWPIGAPYMGGVFPFGFETVPTLLDITEALDLSADVPSWQAGAQIALIGDSELVFLARLYASPDGQYLLDGIIRARRGTARGANMDNVAHWYNSYIPVIAADSDLLTRFTHARFQPGATIWIKTQPRSAAGAVDLGDVTARSWTFDGTYVPPVIVGPWCVEVAETLSYTVTSSIGSTTLSSLQQVVAEVESVPYVSWSVVVTGTGGGPGYSESASASPHGDGLTISDLIFRGIDFVGFPASVIECKWGGTYNLVVEDCRWRGDGTGYFAWLGGAHTVCVVHLVCDQLSGIEDALRVASAQYPTDPYDSTNNLNPTADLYIGDSYFARVDRLNACLRLMSCLRVLVEGCVMVNRGDNCIAIQDAASWPGQATDIVIKDCTLDGNICIYPGAKNVRIENVRFLSGGVIYGNGPEYAGMPAPENVVIINSGASATGAVATLQALRDAGYPV